ncbi:MAG: site-specific DNA-methyltransferase [Polyangiaceae bacterium]
MNEVSPKPSRIDRRAVRAPADTPFARDDARSHGARDTGNLVLHADNRVALPWLRAAFTGAFRCVYLDPPYNTGRAFAHYDDRTSPEAWSRTITEQLEAIRPLVADDGAVFAEIDDTELGSLLVALDRVFGREQRVATITVVRSAPTGHKAKNRGPVNVTDYVIVVAKDRTRFRPATLERERRGYDFAYGTWLDGSLDDPGTWTFSPLRATFAARSGHASVRDAKRASGDEAFERGTVAFAMENADRVVRFAQPRFDAVSHDARALILASKADPSRVLVLERARHSPFFLHRGNRVLFLADKVRRTPSGPKLVEPITNVWDDVPFQGIAREGGVAYVRNKKPERLIDRILRMATRPGDWVLDPFAGSGTTAAVAHKMGRRWVAVESSDAVDSLLLPRLRSVVDGTDATGVTRDHGFTGGGGFDVLA